MEGALVLGLLILVVPFVLPVLALVRAGRAVSRVAELEAIVEADRATIDRLTRQVARLAGSAPAQATAPTVAASPAEAAQPPTLFAQPPPQPHAPAPIVAPPVPLASASAPSVAEPPVPQHSPRPTSAPPIGAAAPVRPAPTIRTPAPPVDEGSGARAAAGSEGARGFDIEQLVGVRLFSAVAGLALIIAAVLFLRYSVERGWLGPTIRFAIGLAVGLGTLMVCELKAARRYPFTANALDAAAVSILFSTFFAAHALWDLIPASATFGFLALVTALAVVLSIRRESVLIAVLGLVGGFATPVLLSTGENQPVPLFAYLLLLNVGLAWVAYRHRWPLLGWLSLGLTTLYQWGWIYKFLTSGQLPLASGIFLVFPVATLAVRALAVATRGSTRAGAASDGQLGMVASVGSALPVAFGLLMATVPAYGARTNVLFGFLFLVGAGLYGVALGRRQWWLHAVGSVATALTVALWLNQSYTHASWPTSLAWIAGLVVCHALAIPLAARLGRVTGALAEATRFTAPALLFAGVGLVAVEPAVASPGILFTTLLALLAGLALVAVWQRSGASYFVAAFAVLAAEVAWSIRYMAPGQVGPALAIYIGFGLIVLAAPVLARRAGRPLQPAAGSGCLLLASLGLAFYLTRQSVAPGALWGLALLIAIQNAGLFIESAAVRLSWLTMAGSALSWVVLGAWWLNAASQVPLLPALLVVVGLSLVTLAGHLWQRRLLGAPAVSAGHPSGLALVAYLFLIAVAASPALAVPPWPLFSAMAVLLLAFSTASLWLAASHLHAGALVAAQVVLIVWAQTAGIAPWPVVALVASGVVSLFAVGWIGVAPRAGDRSEMPRAAAAATLLLALALTMVVGHAPGRPGIAVLTACHMAAFAALLWVVARPGWHGAGVAGVVIGALTAALYQEGHIQTAPWWHALVLAGGYLLAAAANPIVLARRALESRLPYVSILVAAGACFFVGRQAFVLGGHQPIIGLLPVSEAVILTIVLRHLLSIEPERGRDVGRLALVAGAALALVTVAIPLQLARQWITIGWALEGAALAWLYRRLGHRGLFWFALGLLAAVFGRLALNPEVFAYAPRQATPILNWFLYTYAVAAAACLVAARMFVPTDDEVAPGIPNGRTILMAAAGVLLFVLLNIEIADFFAGGTTLEFRFGATLAQDLTYTIGWLVFGLALLVVGIAGGNHPTRVASLLLITVTVLKCFLYDLGRLGGLYRIASFAGLAVSLALVSIALQKYVLAPRKARR